MAKVVAKVQRKVVKKGNEYCVVSEDGERSFGCYPTKGEAEERLREVEFFKQQNSDIWTRLHEVKRLAAEALRVLRGE